MKRIHNAVYALLAAVLGVMALQASGAPTRLQVLVTGDQNKANRMVDQLNAEGYGPAMASPSPDGTTFRILTRSYPSYAEANFAKPRLVGRGYNDAFAVEDPEATGSTDSVFADVPSVVRGGKFAGLQLDFHPKPARQTERPALTEALKALDNNQADEDQLLTKATAFRLKSQADKALAALDSFIARFPGSERAVKARIMRGYWLIEKGLDADAKAQFEAVVSDYPDRAEAGEAALRIGYLMIKEKAQDGDVLAQFLKVAKGEIRATDETRCEAMLRCAALYHRGKDLDTAEAAYRQIGQFAAGDPEVQSFAQMQVAGITMEKAWNGKGTFAQAREVCDDLLQKFPDVNKETRATAALMAMETHCYEKSFQPVLQRGDAFLAEFNDTQEAPLAYYWIAKARMETGDATGAVALLDDVIGAEFTTTARFKHADVNPAARRLAAQAYEKLGNHQKAQALRSGR